MRQRAPEPDTFLMRSIRVAAIATSSLLVRSCKLLCSCRDAARRRCHEFRPDGIADGRLENAIDLRLRRCVEPPAAYTVDRLQLTRVACAPQRGRDSLIQHPADRQVDDAPSELLLREFVELLYGRQILRETRLPEFRIAAAKVVTFEPLRMRPDNSPRHSAP